ncbi:MAG: hypothetical protein HRT61_01405 [Ekhidna sp.]|nr:hypothetical protein [Ekhidna sp.]
MSTVLSRETFKNQLVPGLDAVLNQNYAAIPEDHSKMFELRTSTKRDEEILMTGGFGEAFTKEEGQAIRMDGHIELYKARFSFPTVALGFAVTEEAMEDDLYENNSQIRAQGLGRAMAQTKQTRAANVYNLAFSTDQTGPQGKPMIASDHPTMAGAGTPFSNLLTGELSETALQSARIRITRQKDDRGNFTGARPTQLIIPTGLYYKTHEILKSDLSTTPIQNVAGTENVSNSNVTNVLGQEGLFNNVTECNRLLDDSAWFIRTDIPNGPIMYTRTALQTRDDFDPSRGTFAYFARERYGFGWVDPRAIYGSQG